MLDTAWNDAEGKVTFKTLTYDETDVGAKEYVIREAAPAEDDGAYQYDRHSETVTVTILDNGDGTLDVKADKTGKEVEFINEIGKASGRIVLTAHKSLIANKLTAGQFKFELVQGNEVLDTAWNDAEGKVTFKALTYDEMDVGTKKYVIREVVPAEDDGTYQYDRHSETVTVTIQNNGDGTLDVTADKTGMDVEFVNTYRAVGEIELTAHKTLNGGTLQEHQFRFELLQGGEVLDTAWNDAEGKIAFKTLTYEVADIGTKEYVIREAAPAEDNENYQYDRHSETVTVTIRDNGDGTLKVTADKTGMDVEFVNSFSASAKLVLTAKKEFEGGILTDSMFSFELLEVIPDDGAKEGYSTKLLETVGNSANGTISFSPIEFTQEDVDPETGEGEKNYIIREAVPAEPDRSIIYDIHEKRVKVTLRLQDNGVLTITSKMTPNKVFRNEVEKPTPPKYDYKFKFSKIWQGGTEAGIEFVLYNPDGSVRHKMFNKKTITDTKWEYEAWFATDTEYYVVENVPAGYIVQYENIGKYADVTDRCYNGGTIINKKVPKTGDTAELLLWAGMVLAGIGGITAALVIGKRKKPRK